MYVARPTGTLYKLTLFLKHAKSLIVAIKPEMFLLGPRMEFEVGTFRVYVAAACLLFYFFQRLLSIECMQNKT